MPAKLGEDQQPSGEPISPRFPRLHRTLIWLGCLSAAFIVTHFPPGPHNPDAWITDKVYHFGGFFALSVALVWRHGRGSLPMKMSTMVAGLLLLAAYGAIDEWTQPYFRRDCEFLDWVADLAGAGVGTLVGALVRRRFF